MTVRSGYVVALTELNEDADPVEMTRIATCLANGINPAFDGTYPHAGDEKRAGYSAPPPPGTKN